MLVKCMSNTHPHTPHRMNPSCLHSCTCKQNMEFQCKRNVKKAARCHLVARQKPQRSNQSGPSLMRDAALWEVASHGRWLSRWVPFVDPLARAFPFAVAAASSAQAASWSCSVEFLVDVSGVSPEPVVLHGGSAAFGCYVDLNCTIACQHLGQWGG